MASLRWRGRHFYKFSRSGYNKPKGRNVKKFRFFLQLSHFGDIMYSVKIGSAGEMTLPEYLLYTEESI